MWFALVQPHVLHVARRARASAGCVRHMGPGPGHTACGTGLEYVLHIGSICNTLHVACGDSPGSMLHAVPELDQPCTVDLACRISLQDQFIPQTGPTLFIQPMDQSPNHSSSPQALMSFVNPALSNNHPNVTVNRNQ